MAIDRNLVQGSMAMMILRLLETKDMYGYEMIEALRESCLLYTSPSPRDA